MKTSTIFRITAAVLLIALALTLLIYSHSVSFATFTAVVVTLFLILIALQVQRLRVLARMLRKLDELLEFIVDTKSDRSTKESIWLIEQLREIRALLLKEKPLSLRKPTTSDYESL